jgi:NTE family protein
MRTIPTPRLTTLRLTILACSALLLGGCASVRPLQNSPVSSAATTVADYRPKNMQRGDNTDTLLLTVIFSGGGMRSAAASYYLLDAMRQQPVRIDGREKPLLHEIDFMSSVSGGSIAAAYYALHRERMFEDFVPNALHRDMQGDLLKGFLNPKNAWRLSSDYYGRGDYLADYLDDALFFGKTFADMPRERPFLRIGATDMLTGKRVEFTQEGFDSLCSRLDEVPIARAVAASSAVPGIFSPINIADYSSSKALGDCSASSTTPQRYRHLIDGGVADNLGISGPLQAVGRYRTVVDTMRDYGFRGIRNYAIIVLNVENNPGDARDGSAKIPSLWRTINASIDGNLHTDSAEITATLRNTVQRWQRQIADDPNTVADGIFVSHDPKLFLIEIDFGKETDPDRRERLQKIPTALRLSADNETLLREFVQRSLRESPEYNALLETLARDADAGSAAVSGR